MTTIIVCLQSQVQVLHYAQVQHPATTDRPAPPPPAEQTPVQYATVKKPVTVPITPVNVSLA